MEKLKNPNLPKMKFKKNKPSNIYILFNLFYLYNLLIYLNIGLTDEDFKKGAVGLSHNYYRHKLKFSIDKVDVMVIQAVGLLDDLDKELNNYAMRLREWYGWHFPEVGKILPDNLTYAKVILKMGMRTNAKNIEFGTDLLTPEDEAHIKEAAEISMGSEISTEDELNIKELCNQIIFLTEYRQTLTEYLRTRMMTIAPNLTTMVGELVAARLISHAGSLISLAKMPGSTIQMTEETQMFNQGIHLVFPMSVSPSLIRMTTGGMSMRSRDLKEGLMIQRPGILMRPFQGSSIQDSLLSLRTPRDSSVILVTLNLMNG